VHQPRGGFGVRFGLIHRLVLDSLAVVGLLAIFATGEIDRRTAVVLAIGLILALSAPAAIRTMSSSRKASTGRAVRAARGQAAGVRESACPLYCLCRRFRAPTKPPSVGETEPVGIIASMS